MTKDDDFVLGNDETQEIPVVVGRIDYDVDSAAYPHIDPTNSAAYQPPSSGSSSGYTMLPSDAFAPKTTRKSRRFALTAAAAVIVIGAVGGGAYAIFSTGDAPETAGPAVAAPSAPKAENVDAECPARTDSTVTTGRDAGSSASGTDVIKAFNYAYYTRRDAKAVSEFVLPATLNTIIPSIENLQNAIDALPAATTYCLTITDLGSGLHRVALAQIDPKPGGDRTTFHQMIQTTEENGRWLIVSNTAVD